MTLDDILTPRLGQALRPNIWDIVALFLVIGATILQWLQRSQIRHIVELLAWSAREVDIGGGRGGRGRVAAGRRS